ncbi:MAG: hypothetical protein AAF394_02365, partial [Planctomycetota bacterium]
AADTFQNAIASANATQAAAKEQAHEDYRNEVAAAYVQRDEDANKTDHPTINLAAEALKYAKATQEAKDTYDAAIQTLLEAKTPEYYYWVQSWLDESYQECGSCDTYPGEDLWSLGYEPVTPRDFGDIVRWDEHWETHKSIQTWTIGSAQVKAAYDRGVEEAKHAYNLAMSTAAKTFKDKQAEYKHWKNSNAIQAEHDARKTKAESEEARDKKNADAAYAKDVAAVEAAYTAALASIDLSKVLREDLIEQATNHVNAQAAFFGTAATTADSEEAEHELDFEEIMAPHRETHNLLVAVTNRASGLRIAKDFQDAAYARAEATLAAALKQITAFKDLYDGANDAFLTRSLDNNTHDKTHEDKDSLSNKTHEIAKVDALIKQLMDHNTSGPDPMIPPPELPPDHNPDIPPSATDDQYAWKDAEIAGDIRAVGDRKEFDIARINNGYGNALRIAPINAQYHKDLAIAKEIYDKEIANNEHEHNVNLNTTRATNRDAVAVEINLHDNEVAKALSEKKRKFTEAAVDLQNDLLGEQQTVTNVILPSATNLANLEATTRKDIAIAKAEDRKDAEVDAATAQSTLTSTWHADQNTPWTEYNDKKEQAEATKKTSLANAAFTLLQNTANSVLGLTTTINNLDKSRVLTELSAWIGHGLTVGTETNEHAGETNTSEDKANDEITNETETFDKGVIGADKTRDNSLSENDKEKKHRFAEAEKQYQLDYYNAARIFEVTSLKAWNTYNLANAEFNWGDLTSAGLAAAAAARAAEIATAQGVFDAAVALAGQTRRETEGEGIKTEIIADAQAQKTWVDTAGAAYKGWVDGVGGDIDVFAGEMKVSGVDFSTGTSNSGATANSTSATARHDFNTGSANTTHTTNVAMAGHTAGYNTAANDANNTAATAKGDARGDYEKTLHDDHLASQTSQNTILDDRFSTYQQAIATADHKKALAYIQADSDRLGKYVTANDNLTSALNTADTSLVSSTSGADKTGSIDVSDAGKSRSVSYGNAGANANIGGDTADLELGREVTDEGTDHASELASGDKKYASDVEAARVVFAQSEGEAQKILHVGQNSTAAQEQADAIIDAAQVVLDAAIKAAGITLATDYGTAEVNLASGIGQAALNHTNSWNGVATTYTGATNLAESSFTGDINNALSSWVAGLVAADNADAVAIANAFEDYIADTGQADVDHANDIGDADADHAGDTEQASVDMADGTDRLRCPYIIDTIGLPEGHEFHDRESFCKWWWATVGNNGNASNSQLGQSEYFASAGAARVSSARALEQADADKRTSRVQARVNFDNAVAAADTALANASSAPIAAKTNGSVTEANDLASDDTAKTNDAISDIVSSSNTYATGSTDSNRLYGIDLANALKTYWIGLASLSEGDDTAVVEKQLSDDQAAAKRDDRIREAGAGKTRDLARVADAKDFVTTGSNDSRDFTHGLADLAKGYAVSAAPILETWLGSVSEAEAGGRSDRNSGDNSHRTSRANAAAARRAGDYAAQSASLTGMNTREPSSFLGSHVNLASQRESWWTSVHAEQLSSITAVNTAETTYTNSVNTAHTTADDLIAAAGVTYANTTSTAYQLNTKALATHFNSLVTSVAGFAKIYHDAVIGADHALEVAKAHAEYDLAVNGENSDYTNMINTANEQHQNVVGPARDQFEADRDAARKTRTDADAASNADLDEAIANAEKVYEDAESAAEKGRRDGLAAARKNRSDSLNAVDAALASFGATNWAARLNDPLNQTSDPWFDLAQDLASANSTLANDSSTADQAVALSADSALETLTLIRNTQFDTLNSTAATAAKDFTNSTATAEEGFANKSGQEKVTKPSSGAFTPPGDDEDDNSAVDPEEEFRRNLLEYVMSDVGLPIRETPRVAH